MKKIIILLSLLLVLSLALWAEQVTISGYQNEIRLVNANPNNMELEFTLGSFMREEVQIDGQTWYLPSLKKGGLTLEAGFPQVPVLASSVIIPATAKMDLRILGSEYVDLPMQIAPSKGNLTRDVDPDNIPYSFDNFYAGNGSYPAAAAYLTEPFILRDYRGITVRFQPFVYYPATGITRVYTKLQLAVVNTGTDLTNASSASKNSYAEEFTGIYDNMFLNFNQAKYPNLAEEGRILVIKNAMFDTAILPWVNWKRQMGYTVDVVDVTVAGPTANQIKTYIQNQYDLNDGLMFVQIMGDAPQVPSLSSGGGGSDPSYTLLAGADSYPDIYIGRFSAQTVAEMETQVLRTVHYERDVAPGALWLQRAMGIASNEGGGSQGDMGESDQAHMELIRTDLLTYGYTNVDQMYQTMGATSAQVGANVDNGRGFINYVGHGSDTTWVTTGFSNTHVNALLNDYMLPFIVSVACVNGNFVSQTCFAEAWLRSVNETTGAPAGAVAMYASTINQGWNPPMRGQDEITDLLIAEAKHSIGGLYFNGSSKMIEVYGASGISEFKCWTIFGDASLIVRTKDPVVLDAFYSNILLIGMNTMIVETVPNARMTLSANNVIYGKATADAAGIAMITLDILPDQPMDLTLTITAFNKHTHLGLIQVLPANGPYIIVTDVQVTDDNNNLPEYGETVTVNVDMSNVGSDPALGVSVSVSTSDPYLSVISPAETVSDIPANAIGSTVSGIDLAIATSVPNQYQATYTVTVTLSNGSVYSYDRSFTVAAPALSWGYITVEDTEGNNNNRIDPGETVTISIPFTNTGNAQTPPVHTTLLVYGGNHMLTPVQNDFDILPVNGGGIMVNQVSFSSQIPAGTTVQLTAMSTYGDYVAINIYNVVVGIITEDFEGGWQGFPWAFTGGNWTTVQGSYNNTLAAKTANIAHSQSTSMSVTMNNPADGIISFWKKVSSEANYDYLKFFINGTLKNQWSGTSDTWSQISYMVAAGNNTYRWEYVKDTGTSGGSDCAWIDDVVFPAASDNVGAPAMAVDVSSLDFGNIPVEEIATQSVTVSNLGNASMMGMVTVPDSYTLGDVMELTVSQMNYILGAGESLVINVTFRPLAEGVYAGNMIITSDDPNALSTSIFIMGSATPVANAELINPVVTELKGNYPNPFNPSTSIQFSLKERSAVSIEIYNILGQKVRTLVAGEMAAGTHNLNWNGSDSRGKAVASGVYFYKMQAGKYSSTKKMILMK